MSLPDLSAAASRLCTACGMCCNGVLFDLVQMQPADSIRKLESLGMKLKRKKKEPYFSQPCRALNGCTCTIYADRPTRCRLFECQLIHFLKTGDTEESEAMAIVEQTQMMVKRVMRLLSIHGNEETTQSLSDRYQQVLQESVEEEVVTLQEEMQSLNDLLNRHFRAEPVPLR